MSQQKSFLMRRSQLAFIGMRLLGTPCWCLLSMLVFILYKNVHLSPFQITVLVALKPASSLLSPYWSQAIYQRPDKIIPNLITANFLRYLPFLLIPWIQSSWFIILAFGLYMMLTRGTIPAWMEMFKYNLPETKREQMVGYVSTIDFCGTAILTLVAGAILDHYPEVWRELLSMTAALGIISTWFLSFLTAPQTCSIPVCEVSYRSFSFKEKFLRPWKQIWELLCRNKSFSIFQIGFMLGGGGLMIMQPALPRFFIDTLHLSFTEMGIAIALCKGVGVALTSPLWTRLFRKVNIFSLSSLVTLFAAIFPFLLLATSWHIFLLYLAYVFYGIMQAGSELSWHMSGLVFAKDKDSSLFSVTNVFSVGIRGCMIPFIGSFLISLVNPLGVIVLGALLCLSASFHFLFYSRTLRIRSAVLD